MSKHPITKQNVVLRLPGMDNVRVQRNVSYARNLSHDLRMDIYRHARESGAQTGAVIFVTGYSDIGARAILGCNIKDMCAYTDWARLVACSGITAIAYQNEDPFRDARLVLEHIKRNFVSLGIDRNRLGIWSCSGNGPNALALLQQHADLQCAAFCYAYLTDTSGFDDVARAARQFGFVNPTAELDIGELPDVPLMLARAGHDEMPGLNDSLDRFAIDALDAKLPVHLLNHPSGPHAFDVSDASNRSRALLRQILAFLKAHLIH